MSPAPKYEVFYQVKSHLTYWVRQLRMIERGYTLGAPRGGHLAWLSVLTRVFDRWEEVAAGWTYDCSRAGCPAQLPGLVHEKGGVFIKDMHL